MMYSEFLELSGKSENYIDYKEYTVFIEPIYMDSSITKQEFMAHFADIFERVVYPAVEAKIKSLSIDDKLEMIDCCSSSIFQKIEKVDSAARKVAYSLLRIETCGVN